jgi:predicted Fe-S protein YdhL (DUF1289 family)
MSQASIPPSPVTAVPTPCVRLCVIDAASGLCRGCLRTLEEIAAWSSLTDPGRLAVLAELPGRAGRIQKDGC